MECDLPVILSGEEKPMLSEGQIFGMGYGEGLDVGSEPSIRKALSLTTVFMNDEAETTPVLSPSEPKKCFTLTRDFSIKNVVNGMKRKSKTNELQGDAKTSEDLGENEEPKGQRQVYLRKVLNRVSHSTNRMWTSLGRTFAHSPSVPDLGEQKASSSGTLGRLFGHGRSHSHDLPEDLRELPNCPVAESKGLTLGRRLTSSLGLIKPTKN